jgi:hypothetical protein
LEALVKHLQSRAVYALDVLAGRARGTCCPSCGSRAREPVVKKVAGFATIYRCSSCKLLFRPTGLFSPSVARWYYSWVYSQAGVATDVALSHQREALQRALAEEGKDRSAAVRALLHELPKDRQRIAVFGCSWGYEIELLRRAGLDAYGIELSSARREFAVRELGLEVYDSLASAGSHVRDTGLVLSSHVLEHIPRLDATLREIDRYLAPRVQLHIVPAVEPQVPIHTVRHVVGREHPLGVTGAFWQGWAGSHGFQPALTVQADELWCTLRRAGQESSAWTDHS